MVGRITSGSSGTTFQVFFYNCTAHKACATVQFHAGYDLTKGLAMDRVNAWNSSQRFGRAYLDKDSDPILSRFTEVKLSLEQDTGWLQDLVDALHVQGFEVAVALRIGSTTICCLTRSA